jgi:hypothetical protein
MREESTRARPILVVACLVHLGMLMGCRGSGAGVIREPLHEYTASTEAVPVAVFEEGPARSARLRSPDRVILCELPCMAALPTWKGVVVEVDTDTADLASAVGEALRNTHPAVVVRPPLGHRRAGLVLAAIGGPLAALGAYGAANACHGGGPGTDNNDGGLICLDAVGALSVGAGLAVAGVLLYVFSRATSVEPLGAR